MSRPTINQTHLIHAIDPGTYNTNLGTVGVGATEQTYEVNGFDPQADPSTPANLSYTSARKAQRRYNKYPTNSDYSVFCYLDDWSQYDTRYKVDSNTPNFSTGGRGADYLWLKDSAYDKCVLGFAGIIGFDDPTNSGMNPILNRAASDFGIIPENTNAAAIAAKGAMTFADAWGDVATYLNCGFSGWVGPSDPSDYTSLYRETTAQGVLGALTRKMDKSLSFSLGGWTLSYAYSELCHPDNIALRDRLISSIKEFLTRFPSFTHIDLDWEYPGSSGNGNHNTPDDGVNFASLIQRIHSECGVGISIAISANVEALKAAKIAETINILNACDVKFNMMSYDLFTLGLSGTTNPVGHHANLFHHKGAGTSEHSIKDAVDYLIACGVKRKNIFVGFAGYTRNARNTTLTEVTPLTGVYNTEGRSTVGSFEPGVTEWADLLTNYLNLEGMAKAKDHYTANKLQLQSTGFVLCTDTLADADFLYNPSTKLFMSIETPRSVYKKAKYVKEQGLGGLFIWTGDQDSGLLVNAAWEGLGFTPTNANPFDMTPYYTISGVTSIQELDILVNQRIHGLKVPREPKYTGGN